MVRRLGLGKNNHLSYASLALNPRTVNHDMLWESLKAMGVKSFDWFRSYLSHQTKVVHVNDTECQSPFT